MIPLLQNCELIVVTGEAALTAIDGLRRDAETGGLRPTSFVDCVFVPPQQFAAMMRGVARQTGAPSIVYPLRDRTRALMDMADLCVIAPAGTGRRVWLIPRDRGAFSVCLPPKPTRIPSTWSFAVEHLMATHVGSAVRQ